MPNSRFIKPPCAIALVALLCTACGAGSPIAPDADDREPPSASSQGGEPAAAMPVTNNGASEEEAPAQAMPDTGTDDSDPNGGQNGDVDTGADNESTADGPIACKRFDAAEREAIVQRINAARAEARDCGSERYAATTPLTWSTRLEDAARRQSDDMATNNFFSHTGSDGSDLGSRVDATGYQLSFAGENIAAGQRSDEEALAGWLESPGHCRNLMSPNFRDVAMACSEDPGTDYTRYWTQVFAAPR